MSDQVISGSCQCGHVTFKGVADPLVSYICHCRECQQQSASAFAISVPLRRQWVSFDGDLSVYERPADSGARTSCWFCAACGTRIFHQSSSSVDFITLKGGLLQNAASLKPVAHLWTTRKHDWLVVPSSAEIYQTQPKDLGAWRRRLLAQPD